MTLLSDHPVQAKRPSQRVRPMRVLFALPGLHRVARGAEVAFEEIATRMATVDGIDVTLSGSGQPRPDAPYRFLHANCSARETFLRWPKFPGLRDHYMYEELTFAPRLWKALRHESFDITVTCGYPYTNWLLRRQHRRDRSKHVFVTQNGDWMVQSSDWEYRYFDCDGLICTNPTYFERSNTRYHSALIPNGVDMDRFRPGRGHPERFGLRSDRPVVLMVSALIACKRVLEGIEAASRLPGVQLLVVGHGELGDEVQRFGQAKLGDRFRLVALSPSQMPEAYRAATAFLHMSVDEPFGNVYLEALATGLPIVCHDQPSTRWMLMNQATFVDTTVLDHVASALAPLLLSQSTCSIESRLGLIDRCYRWELIAEQYAQFFRELIQDN